MKKGHNCPGKKGIKKQENIPESCISEVQRVRLSRRSCMMRVESLYDSSERVSSSAMASSKACLARWQARSGELRIS